MNGVNAVIMAGGFGTRLKPITDIMPKPLVPILNEPVMAHVIRNLCKYGVNDAAVTLKYMPEMIKNTFSDCYAGVNLKYYTEDEPMGTAGGVKLCESFLTDDFIVVSADGMWDYDLDEVYNFHKVNNADVTIVCSKTSTPSLYGIVLSDKAGRIIRFCEKPSAGEVFSDTINTGIYIIRKEILKYVPENTVFDFSRDLFPVLLKDKKRLFSYKPEGAWCDVGSLEEYRKCNIDALCGKYSHDVYVPSYKGIYGCVLSDSVSIGDNTSICKSVIHENVKIGNGVSITASTVCKGVIIEDGVTIPKGCVIGADCIIKKGISFYENTIIGTGQTITGENIMRNVIKKGSLFGVDGISCDFYRSLGSDGICALGTSLGCLVNTVGVMHDGEPLTQAINGAFTSGVVCGGAKCMNYGTGFYSMANFINMYYKLDVTVFIKKGSGDSNIHLFFRDKDGLKIKSKLENKIEELFFSRDFPLPNDIFETESVNGAAELYRCALIKEGSALDGVKIIISHTVCARLLGCVLTSLGAEVYEYTTPDSDEYFCIDIDENSTLLKISHNKNGELYTIDKHRARAIITALEDKEKINTLSLSYFDIPIYEEIAKSRGIDVMHYLESPFSDIKKDDEARKNYYSNMYMCDVLCTAVKLLSLLKTKGMSLKDSDGILKPFYVREDFVKVPYEKRASSLSKLYEENAVFQRPYGDGVTVKRPSAVSYVGADDCGFKIITEAYNISAARDIVDEIIKQLNI